MNFNYDVIVVGAGHAGCEAAAASARLGARTLLVTADLNRVAQMSCNPAVGGIAKGQIVREIDALGGWMGIVTDRTAIQFRMLNRKKGPAVWSPRAQSDRMRFSEEWRKILESAQGLDLHQDMVASLIIEPADNPEFKYEVKGVRTLLGMEFRAPKVILTAGTFLGGLMHFGSTQIAGGRISEPSSEGITQQLADLGFETGRMKTGTPARISGRSIDFTLCERQDGEDPNPSPDSSAAMPPAREPHKFSYLPEEGRRLMTRGCYITHTSPAVHKILNDNLADSPLYNGQIRSIGPRYCPSIETKIVTFADKDSHQLFLEPEGETTDEYYINGFSSSLPWEVQLRALEQIPALRDIHFYRPGYAIEYDYFPPTQLTHDLQTRLVGGLYFAGQVNGTTGYEEAAAQGLMAGINAARASQSKAPLTLRRDQAYIGVLIDDLVTKGVDEPYRMFTSRAEYRILLRQDDADMRLTPIGYEIGLADDHRHEVMVRKREARDSFVEFLQRERVGLDNAVNDWLESKSTTPLTAGTRMTELLKRPQLTLADLIDQFPRVAARASRLPAELREEIIEAVEILVKYDGYILRERQLADKMVRLENVRLSPDFDYQSVTSLSIEARQKLTRHRPRTLGEASRISGVSPADVSILMMLAGA
ncbi:MAG: tRNA uridine-5-carboxymethylaminomethyl(34) synthesis enzyme MnmG [Muribaculaceae bacterium]|nr:tRNA uridine-5-carboxymethylaminomethyl(34) synthesis enzyme MnmG [Muribaculaceae bacterium]